MADSDRIAPERIRRLNDVQLRAGDYVFYWMQQSQRAVFNPALEFAVDQADELNLPVVVGFGLTSDVPEAPPRAYPFMLEGLTDVDAALSSRGIPFVARAGAPPDVALELARRAAVVVCDRGYLRWQRAWRRVVAERAECPVFEIEGDAMVPVETASNKAEYAARTLRPKIHRLLPGFLKSLDSRAPRHTIELDIDRLDPSDPGTASEAIGMPLSTPDQPPGGHTAARRRLDQFIAETLPDYAERRGHPEDEAGVSGLSPYLHFGQISPLEIALAVRQAEVEDESGRAAFLEELIVRRELAANFVHFTPDYDRYEALPEWTRRTLAAHAGDRRDPLYSAEELESAATTDRYWNAAMTEMRLTGQLHNRMRMYWGKKILEWSASPEEAYATALRLNNRYFLDGRDANSFANVAWLFGLHDRPWPERPIYGTVRSMSRAGLERKVDPVAYAERIERLADRASELDAP
jgi:deoxyribodipyrimidine photo-lyase